MLQKSRQTHGFLFNLIFKLFRTRDLLDLKNYQNLKKAEQKKYQKFVVDGDVLVKRRYCNMLDLIYQFKLTMICK